MYPQLPIFVIGLIGGLLGPYFNAWLHRYRSPVARARAQVSAKEWAVIEQCTGGATVTPSPRVNGIVTRTFFCPDGDLLVNASGGPFGAGVYTWITTGEKKARQRTAMNVPAEDRRPRSGDYPDDEILCQKRLSDREVLLRIKRTDGTCVDEKIDTRSNKVMSIVDADCSAGC